MMMKEERAPTDRPFHQRTTPGPNHALGTIRVEIDTAPITSLSVFQENEETEYEDAVLIQAIITA